MNTSEHQLNWEVEACGTIYEAAFEELPDWINEGSLVPGDKVRRGNLRWIEAGKVPALVPFFNAKANGEPMPPIVKETKAKKEVFEALGFAHSAVRTTNFGNEVLNEMPTVEADPNCAVHRDRDAAYVCEACNSSFCKTCPSGYGGSVKICPACGALCKGRVELEEELSKQEQRANADIEGFGFGDLIKAIKFPFNHRSSLIIGGLMFAFFSFGRSATSFGGFMMVGAGLFCMMLSNMLTFGVLANTVSNFTQGRLEADFMPSFDEFSIWDDVLHPFFLSIGVYISSFGPFVVVMMIGVYMIMGTLGSQRAVFQNEISKVPGTEFYTPDNTASQSEQVKRLVSQIKEQNDDRLELQSQTATEGSQVPSANDAKNDELWRSVQAERLKSAVPNAENGSDSQIQAMVREFLRIAAPLAIIGLITFLWGAFYFPAACAVAGYTRSFRAVMNPSVGLDTIKRLGVDYVKVLLMGLAILVASGAVGVFLSVLFSPFNIPIIGNLPAKVLGSLAGFYFSVVFSCVIGFALYKAADRLKLPG